MECKGFRHRGGIVAESIIGRKLVFDFGNAYVKIPRPRFFCAGVAELSDALDSKSSVRKGMRVRLSPSALALICKYVTVAADEAAHGERTLQVSQIP